MIVEQKKIKLVHNPAIDLLVTKLIKIRCDNDITLGPTYRHCCATFVEKNKSCLQPYFYGNKSRNLCGQKNEHRPRSLHRNPISSRRRDGT
jgi:hypothetical protein